MRVCLRGRIYLRRYRRRLRRFMREVYADIKYRHIWQPVKNKAAGTKYYICALCMAESVSPIGGHRDRCPGRDRRNVFVTP